MRREPRMRRSYGPEMTDQLAIWPSSATVFRPVHYLGCKLRLLDVLDAVVNDVDPVGGRLLDLFSGTGVVAAHFARQRLVVAVDVQEYARVLAAALMTSGAALGDWAEELPRQAALRSTKLRDR